ncbi:hypothetical protein M0R88_15835 [Halorussus gelatinilyticus]|uniref:Uncharacterized protein n=1 Tax=Halorussus gelatinilyticus TaxID=2937524 RepID=A0A8U0IGY4_9EURY|nr:hypothetical protein [Halorussus gelatinilyticus]UPV99974.1 hypothetical protein M0R88_15835 [Halorussus gelatinilyticus]
MALEPQWSERLSKTGPPEQPLRADSVRNGIASTIARGITTDVRARGRYLSGFCWAMHRITTASATADFPRTEKRQILKGFEEILALASYRRRQVHGEVTDGLSGLTGKTNASDDELYNSDSIDLSSFSLLDNSQYAIRGFQSNLGNFSLKEGEFQLTAAGRSLAESLDNVAGRYFDRILDAVQTGRVSLDLLDELAEAFTHQGCFTGSRNEPERDSLQRVVLGLFSWDEREQTVSLATWPSQLDIPIDHHYRYLVSEERHSNDLKDAVVGGVHYLRRAWCLSILRTQQLLQNSTDQRELQYDDIDAERFQPFRPIGRAYFLQVLLAHALRSELWGLSAHLKREAPGGTARSELLAGLREPIIVDEANAVLNTETRLNDERMSQSSVAKELLLAGRVTPTTYETTVPGTTSTRYTTLGDVQDWLDSNLTGEWRPTTDDSVNCWTLLHATELSFESVEAASTPSEAFNALSKLVARSTVQLLAVVRQYNHLTTHNDLFNRYMQAQYGRRPSSLVQTAQYVDTIPPETSLSTVARQLFEDRVIDVHNQVVQDRLGSGPISLVFGVGADSGGETERYGDDTLYAAGGTKQPGTQTLRYNDLRRLMRDAGLLTYNADQDLWIPTEDGEVILARFRGEYE